MKDRKGFTLIELLAVIVILAIIAVIATPIITGIIEDSKKSAAADSAYGALDGVKSYYTSSLLADTSKTLQITVDFANGSTAGDVKGYEVKMSGTKPTAGKVTLNADGTYTITPASGKEGLTVNGYDCKYADQKFTCSK